MKSTDIFAETTRRIMDALESGKIPWWENPIKDGYPGLPCNLVTKRPYSGINVLLLSTLGYESPYFATFNQIKSMKGKIKAGEKSTEIVFWDIVVRHKETKEVISQDEYLTLPKEKKHEYSVKPWGRFYHVFNTEQCEDLDVPKPSKKPTKTHNIKRCEEIWEGYTNRPKLEFKSSVPCYVPQKDLIQMPKFDAFVNTENAWATLYHEAVHSTGHQDRLNRPGVTEKISFGSNSYSQEELVAEIGSAFLCAHTGIQSRTFDNSVGYVHSWLKVLANDKFFIIKASSEAQKAFNYILNGGRV